MVSSGIMPAPIKNKPKTMNTIPICSIPMLVTTCYSWHEIYLTVLRVYAILNITWLSNMPGPALAAL